MVEQVAENPEIPVTAVQDQFARKFEVGVSRMQAYRARAKAKKVVEGDYTKQYAMLRDYGLELKDKNPVGVDCSNGIYPKVGDNRYAMQTCSGSNLVQGRGVH
ncbi:hypothetical protein L1987_35075 [Smallanthus sonchifolius]|uniref:Uncharacterized protein n=1 Tax=Smallanthus sonchifolius TaxID=185202 RepID=A0ACB9HW21_9ASTR|nr:hypothetical protein L1987_35075 [Smallanthus sonchifolius]